MAAANQVLTAVVMTTRLPVAALPRRRPAGGPEGEASAEPGSAVAVGLQDLAEGHGSPAGHVGLASVPSGGGGVAPLLEATGKTLCECSLLLQRTRGRP